MKWTIPAKTFLVGEYVALFGGSAIVLTTSPCFEIMISDRVGLHGIHPDSPAGRWWMERDIQSVGLQWYDPYQGQGGMGASSAQFLGAYVAYMYLKQQSVMLDEILVALTKSAWQGVGISPSGYDVIAQSMQGCVYVNRQKAIYQSYAWPFQDLAFILIHTGKKLATHHHLKDLTPLKGIDALTMISESAYVAFKLGKSGQLIAAINAYHQQLLTMGLVAPHAINAIERLQQQDGVLAVKGCGALGADILLVIVPTSQLEKQIEHLMACGWTLIASSQNVFLDRPKTLIKFSHSG